MVDQNAYPRQEAQTRVINMDDDDASALHHVLQFLYTGDYDTNVIEPTQHPTDRIRDVRGHTEIYLLAEKYAIWSLRHLAGKRAKESAEQISVAAS